MNRSSSYIFMLITTYIFPYIYCIILTKVLCRHWNYFKSSNLFNSCAMWPTEGEWLTNRGHVTYLYVEKPGPVEANFSVNGTKYINFDTRKLIWKCRLQIATIWLWPTFDKNTMSLQGIKHSAHLCSVPYYLNWLYCINRSDSVDSLSVRELRLYVYCMDVESTFKHHVNPKLVEWY